MQTFIGVLELERAIDRNPLTVSLETPVLQVIQQMSQECLALPSSKESPPASASPVSEGDLDWISSRTACALVMDGGQLVGIFTRQNVICLVATKRNLEETTMAEVMSYPVITRNVADLRDRSAILDWMRQRRIQHLPILDGSQHLVGVVTSNSLLMGMQQAEATLSNIITHTSAAIKNFRVLPNTWERGNWTQVYEYFSAGCEIIFGYAPTEFRENDGLWRSRVFPEDLETVVRKADEDILAGKNVEYEYRFYRKDGSLRWISESLTTRPGEVANSWVVTGVSIDISDRKATATALKQLNQELERRVEERSTQLQLAFAAAKMGTWEWNMVADTQHWSPENCELLGLCINEQGLVLDQAGNLISSLPTNELFLSYVHPDDRERLLQTQKQALEQNRIYECEFRLVQADGSIRWCYSRGAYVFDPQGQPIKLAGIGMDITERKRTDLRVQRQAEADSLLATIAQTINQSVYLDEVLEACLEQVRLFVGCDRLLVCRFDPGYAIEIELETVSDPMHSLVGRNLYDPCLAEGYAERYRQGYMTTINDTWTAAIAPCYAELLAQMQVRASLVAPIMQADHLWGLLIAHQCETARQWQPVEIALLKQLGVQIGTAGQKSALYKQLENELQHKEVLIKEVHHRVKNNLQVISSLLSLQSSAIEDPDILQPFIESQHRIDIMAMIHEQLYCSDNLASLNFAKYVEDLVEDLFQSYSSFGSFIQWRVEVANLCLDLDLAIPCGLIINELVSNATKYAFPDGLPGEIEICFQCQHSSYALTVRDNGIGFPQNKDFRKTDSLGMQIVCALTRQLEGTIDLYCDRGTTFKIVFPNCLPASRS